MVTVFYCCIVTHVVRTPCVHPLPFALGFFDLECRSVVMVDLPSAPCAPATCGSSRVKVVVGHFLCLSQGKHHTT